MKKTLLIAIAVLIVSALAVPQVVGMKTQEQLNTRVSEIWSNKVFDVKPTTYDRGWLSSVARVELGLTDEYKNQIEESIRRNSEQAQVDVAISSLREYLDTTIPLRVDVKHGPFINGDSVTFGLATTETQIDTDAAWVQEFLTLAQIPYLMEVRTVTGFSGVTKFDADMPEFTIQEQDVRLAFTGITMNGTFEYADLRLISDTRLNGFEIETGDLKAALRNMSIQSDNVKISELLWAGTVQGSLDEISMRSTAKQNPMLFKMDNVAITSDTQLNDDKISIDIDYRIQKISMPENIFVDDLEFGVAFQNIDVNAAELFYELQATTPSIEATGGQIPPEMNIALHSLLASSPSMQLEPLAFKWVSEPLVASIHVDFAGDKLPSADEFDMLNVGMWMNVLSARMSLDLSQALANRIAVMMSTQQLNTAVQQGAQIPVDQIETMAQQQAPILLFTLQQQGMINEGGLGYISKLSYVDGELLVNGQPMPLGPIQ